MNPVVPTPLPADAFTDLDRELAALLERLAGGANPAVAWAAALVSRNLRDGHTCLNLARWAGTSVGVGGDSVQLPALESWREQLTCASSVVGGPDEAKPLILDAHGRLFLCRLWRDEESVAAVLRNRLAAGPVAPLTAALGDSLRRCFPGGPTELDWQMIAAFSALRNRFTVISGGPGTGKTTTAVKVLALLIEQAGARRLRFAVATPTGKAAARLQEAIRVQKPKLPFAAEVVAQIPEEVRTIHRLIGLTPTSPRPRHDATHPLAVDVLLVDEASMVDLSLLALLLRALPPEARVILLGDRDQLPSVEAGNLLADLCVPEATNRFPPGAGEAFRKLSEAELPGLPPGTPPPLAGHVVQLQRNYRFEATSAIHGVSQAINRGDIAEALALLDGTKPHDGSARREPSPPWPALKAALRGPVLEGWAPVFQARTPEEALAALNGFRILCALREGPWGVAGLNALVTEILREAGFARGSDWFPGRQVMVTTNDYGLRLFNGDVGVAWPSAARHRELAVLFPDPAGGVREVPAARLPPHEDAFALTVHKSQGSEFHRVLVVLPPEAAADAERFWSGPGRVLTRELLYTAVTRARREVRLWADEAVLARALGRRVERESALAERLRPTQRAAGFQPAEPRGSRAVRTG